MSRIKQNQLTETLIEAIGVYLKNRCSLSSVDRKVLEEAVVELKTMRKGKTNEKRLEIAIKVLILFSKFLHD